MRSLHSRLPRFAIAAVAALTGVACASRAPVETTDGAPSTQARDAEPPQRGALRRWPEATSYLLVDLAVQPPAIALGLPRKTGLDTFWSIASTEGRGSAFFYSGAIHGSEETRVAHPDVARIQDIHDASAFDYSAPSVGPVPAGGIVLVHHLPSDRYLALVVDAIAPVDPGSVGAGPWAYADITWYLSREGGSADFSLAF